MVDRDLLQNYSRSLIIENNRLLLLQSNLNYIVEIPFADYSNEKVIKISKSEFKNTIRSKDQRMQIQAVYGLIQLEVMRYLIVVTKATKLGQIVNRNIYQVDKVEFVPLGSKVSSQDQYHISQLQNLFNVKQFYFSDDYDLTCTFQQFADNDFKINKRKSEFFYNQTWVKQFIKLQMFEWITGFISGFVYHCFVQLSQQYTSSLIIISRRDKRRQGARWICRGVDQQGNTVNTVQTQQILYIKNVETIKLLCFVQIRGSMPFKWQQKPNLKWSPECKVIGTDQKNYSLCRKHFQDQKKSYQNFTVLNLINKNGSQKILGNWFLKCIHNIKEQNIKFVWFDFHRQCKNMKYQNLCKLLDIVAKQLDNYGFTHIEIKNKIVTKKNSQNGVFRINCMDCLDRTNVVQSVIARNILHRQLNFLGIKLTSLRILSAMEKLPIDLQKRFRVIWTKNGDAISTLYSGTPAMKSDFTLLNQRTFKGAIIDGSYAIKRWILGNFYDYQRQNANDILSGKLNLTVTKVKKPKVNMLFLLLIFLIFAPFLVFLIFNHYIQKPLTQQLQIQKISSILKILVWFLSMFFVVKVCQLSHKQLLTPATIDD